MILKFPELYIEKKSGAAGIRSGSPTFENSGNPEFLDYLM
jgi:hypothetical protein